MLVTTLVALIAGGLALGEIEAGDYYTTVTPGPIFIGGDEGASRAEEVPGKEYSHTDWFSVYHGLPPAGPLPGDPNLVNVEDHNSFAAPDPVQVVSWDGIPCPHGPACAPFGPNSGSVDGFDFSVPGFEFADRGQIDALAHHNDAFFSQVVRNRATLLFSVTGDIDISSTLPPPDPMTPSSAGIFAKAHVHFEDPDPPSPLDPLDVWAPIETPPAGPGIGPGVNHHVVEDLDALEVWGPDPPTHDPGSVSIVEEGYIGGFGGANSADGDRFSLDMDSLSGVSVWGYNILSGGVSPYIPHAVIVDAVEELFLGPGVDFAPETINAIDVDGHMVRDLNIDSPTAPSIWDDGDELLFTIDPVATGVIDSATGGIVPGPLIDGGEIMHLVNLGGGLISISFLSHGGHLWDTGFDVSGTFGYYYEDVDALEAVGTAQGIEFPEPTTIVLLALAAALTSLHRPGKQK